MTSTGPFDPTERKMEARPSERKGPRSPFSGVFLQILIAGILIILALNLVLKWSNKNASIPFSTPYQAVLLTNGSVYFGQIQGYGTPNPMLNDAFYVVSRTDPVSKQVSNVLVKRGKELHQPDRMYINPNQIVFVETVGASSKVAQLIAQSTNQ